MNDALALRLLAKNFLAMVTERDLHRVLVCAPRRQSGTTTVARALATELLTLQIPARVVSPHEQAPGFNLVDGPAMLEGDDALALDAPNVRAIDAAIIVVNQRTSNADLEACATVLKTFRIPACAVVWSGVYDDAPVALPKVSFAAVAQGVTTRAQQLLEHIDAILAWGRR